MNSKSDNDWFELKSVAELGDVDVVSTMRPVVLFKHSTRCGVSSIVLNRFRRSWGVAISARPVVYFIDLLAHRALSNAVAQRYQIEHESPQVLVVHHGACVGTWSHGAIDLEVIQGIIRERSAP
jgi:bacillithiol system protein YtxJ